MPEYNLVEKIIVFFISIQKIPPDTASNKILRAFPLNVFAFPKNFLREFKISSGAVSGSRIKTNMEKIPPHRRAGRCIEHKTRFEAHERLPKAASEIGVDMSRAVAIWIFVST